MMDTVSEAQLPQARRLAAIAGEALLSWAHQVRQDSPSVSIDVSDQERFRRQQFRLAAERRREDLQMRAKVAPHHLR